MVLTPVLAQVEFKALWTYPAAGTELHDPKCLRITAGERLVLRPGTATKTEGWASASPRPCLDSELHIL